MSTDWSKLIAMRFTQILLILIFIVLITIVVMGLFSNKPIKMWGLEFNTVDTVYITKHDTITLTAMPHATIPASKTPSQVQKNNSGKNEINQNSGTNYGAIGGSGNIVNNQFGKKDRQVSDSLIDAIIFKAPNKNMSISILRRSNDEESMSYATKINTELRNRGYKNVFINGTKTETIFGLTPEETLKYYKTPKIELEDGQLNVTIPSN